MKTKNKVLRHTNMFVYKIERSNVKNQSKILTSEIIRKAKMCR